MSILYYESSISHHGIKGQKWGVRRYQNPDGTLTKAGRFRLQKKTSLSKYEYPYEAEFDGINQDRYFKDTVLKKGTKVQHVSSNKKISLKNEKMYVSVDDEDNAKYVKAMAKELSRVYGKTAYKHVYELNEDIKAPSKKKAIDIFRKVYNHDKDQTMKDLDSAFGSIYDMNDDYFNLLSGYKQAIKYDKNYSIAYDLLNTSLGYWTMEHNTKTSSRYFEELSKNGYNALIDETDSLNWPMNAKLPLIILDAKKDLNPNGDGKKITNKDVKEAAEKYDLKDLNEFFEVADSWDELLKKG